MRLHSAARSALSASTWSASTIKPHRAERGREPGAERRADAVRERQHGRAEEHAVRFLVIRIGVVARNAEQLRRHAEGERDLARRGVLRLHEVHVLRRERHRLPVEPAFEQQRTAGIARALVVRPRARASAARTDRRPAPCRRSTSTSAPQGRAALSSSALFHFAAALCVSTATLAASSGARP